MTTQPVDSSILHEIVRIIEARRKVPDKVIVTSKEYLLTYLEDHRNRLEEALMRFDRDRLNMLYGQLASKVKYQFLRRVPARAAAAMGFDKVEKPAAKPAAKVVAKPAAKKAPASMAGAVKGKKAAPAKKASAKKAPAKKAPPRKAAAKKAAAPRKKPATVKKATAKKGSAKKAAPRRAAARPKKKARR